MKNTANTDSEASASPNGQRSDGVDLSGIDDLCPRHDSINLHHAASNDLSVDAPDNELADLNGHVKGDPEYNPFNTKRANATHGRAAVENAAEQSRVMKWASKYYDVGILDGLQDAWARKLAAQIDRENALRDPVGSTPPRVMFKGDRAVKLGATDEQLMALPRLSLDEIRALRIKAAALKEIARQHVRELAKQLGAIESQSTTPPSPVTLTELLNEPDEDATYRVEGLWPSGGRVLLAAPYKAGKTTLVGNLLKCLLDGGDFLDRFPVEKVRKVVLIDTELPRRTLRRWLRDHKITGTDQLTIVSLRGAASTFDILDPAVRAKWARQFAAADVIVLDCLRPIIDALGLSEDKDAGKVFVAFDALLAESGCDEGLIITHMGHQNERARGDSRQLDYPDALWNMVRDDNGISFFSALGRDVSVPEGALTYDPEARHLSFSGGNRTNAAARKHLPLLLSIVSEKPGQLSKNAVENKMRDEHGVRQKDTRAAIGLALGEGLLTVAPGERNSQLLSVGTGPLVDALVKAALDSLADDGSSDDGPDAAVDPSNHNANDG